MATVTELSEAARTLLRRILSSERVGVTPGNLEAHRELAAAGVLYPVSTFARGPESTFRFTEQGWNRRESGSTALLSQSNCPEQRPDVPADGSLGFRGVFRGVGRWLIGHGGSLAERVGRRNVKTCSHRRPRLATVSSSRLAHRGGPPL